MITEAQSRGVDVIIATVMPVLPTWRQYQPGTTLPKIQALNAQIFALAAQYNLGLPVDLFAMFDANPELIGADGLHPTRRRPDADRRSVPGRNRAPLWQRRVDHVTSFLNHETRRDD